MDRIGVSISTIRETLSELDDDEGGSESAAELLEPNEALTNDIINEAKIRIWLRFAGCGVL
ncbi:MAG: hypothetical protein WB949_06565 [Candidatus Acidiferrales bacterium]